MFVEDVVATEMSNSWPIEALKAQAVAARSYAVSLGSKHSAHHFDICDDVDCQAYTGQTSAGPNTRAAVEQTAGLGVLYNGKPAQSFYYSSNGGASESVSNVWGSNQTSYPYLIGKVDPYEPTLNLKNTWERTFTSSQIISKLLSAYQVTAPIVSAAVTVSTDIITRNGITQIGPVSDIVLQREFLPFRDVVWDIMWPKPVGCFSMAQPGWCGSCAAPAPGGARC